jgi:LysM repeat protein
MIQLTFAKFLNTSKKKKFCFLFGLLLMTLNLIISGCSTVSEQDVENLKEETNTLAAELLLAKQEADILNRALNNAYIERDRLIDLLNETTNPSTTPSNTTQSAEAPVTPQAQTTQTKIHITKPGDTLSIIAQRYNTSVEAIIKLNPFLKTRRDFMLMEHDPINLP